MRRMDEDELRERLDRIEAEAKKKGIVNSFCKCYLWIFIICAMIVFTFMFLFTG